MALSIEQLNKLWHIHPKEHPQMVKKEESYNGITERDTKKVQETEILDV